MCPECKYVKMLYPHHRTRVKITGTSNSAEKCSLRNLIFENTDDFEQLFFVASMKQLQLGILYE